MEISSFSYVLNEHIKNARDSFINGILEGEKEQSIAANASIKTLCHLAISLLEAKKNGHSLVNNPQKLKAGLLKTKEKIEKKVIGQGNEGKDLAVQALQEIQKLRDHLK